MKPYPTILARILANTRTVAGMEYRGVSCRLWTRSTNIGNYPHMCVRKPGKKKPVKVLVHRIACAIENGPPPSRKSQAMHLCNMPTCVEGKHLKWGTQSQNRNYFVATGGAYGGDEAVPGLW